MTDKLTCDVCGKEISGIENFINAGDKVVCSEYCKQKAVAQWFIDNSLTRAEINGKMNPDFEKDFKNA